MTKVEAAIVQASPIPFNVEAGIAKAAKLAGSAIADGATLIAFGETFLGAYPVWVDAAPGAALWEADGAKAIHRILLADAIRGNDPRFAPLQSLCDDHGAIISIGGHERERNSLFNSQFVLRPGAPPLVHRKLVPTHGERLLWSRGDGSTLNVHEAAWGKVGNLICWEHWMPLARAAMHNLGETVHVAAWPTVRDIYEVASRHYAYEGRCFVLAAGLVQTRTELVEGALAAGGGEAAAALLASIPDEHCIRGGSLIIGPDAQIIARTGDGEEIVRATLDIDQVGQGLAALDTDGHYARPDVFSLLVDSSPKEVVIWEKGDKSLLSS